VTTDDYEFELIVPRAWVERTVKGRYLHHDSNDSNRGELAARKKDARSWYAPKPLGQYEFYRDLTSVGYLHMLVEKSAETDGRHRVFISKH
jgi:hypothetical protein